MHGKKVFTYCKQGFTLIQKTDPDVGNNKFYFNRGWQDYEHGFGFANKEMFLGLKNIYLLNQNNKNNILRLELTTHDENQLRLSAGYLHLVTKINKNSTYKIVRSKTVMLLESQTKDMEERIRTSNEYRIRSNRSNILRLSLIHI